MTRAAVACLLVLSGCCTEDTLDGVAFDGAAAGYDRASDRYLLGWWTLEHDSMDRELHLGSLDQAGVFTEGSVISGGSWLEVIAENDGRHLVTAQTELELAVMSVVSTDGHVLASEVLAWPGAVTGVSLTGRALDVPGGFLVLTDVSGAWTYDLVLRTIDRDGVVVGSTTAIAGAAKPDFWRQPFYLSRAGDAVWIVYQDESEIRASLVTAGVAGPSLTLTSGAELMAVASAGDRILALAWRSGNPNDTVVIRLDEAGAFTAVPRPDLPTAGILVAFPGAGYMTNGRMGDAVWLDLDAAQVGGYPERRGCFPPDRSVIAGVGGDGLLLDCRRSYPDPGRIVTTMSAVPIRVGGSPQFTAPVLFDFEETTGSASQCNHGND